ncbi:MAG: dienelactone hydrolase family protein [Bacteroidetes bacterium]|nr:dienelactone hydrolase family protein [Bacteroidota bacterium]
MAKSFLVKQWVILMAVGSIININAITCYSQDKLTFKSSDGVSISADLYQMHLDSAPMIILFHQAGWSRGEYLEIAPKLNHKGFNCIAVDQRSGNQVNNIPNQTFKNARQAMKPTQYLDALPDMEAAIKFAREKFAHGKLLIWGSSYSASLVLKLAGDGVEVDGVLAFSPGEYFKSFGKSSDYISNSAKNIYVPVFITSARSEKKSWQSIYEAIPSDQKKYFVPETSGNHGSRALWEKFYDQKAYWAEVDKFLSQFL